MDGGEVVNNLETSKRVLYGTFSGSSDGSGKLKQIGGVREFGKILSGPPNTLPGTAQMLHTHTSESKSDTGNLREIFSNPGISNIELYVLTSQCIGQRLLQSPDTVFGRTFDSLQLEGKGGTLYLIDRVNKGVGGILSSAKNIYMPFGEIYQLHKNYLRNIHHDHCL